MLREDPGVYHARDSLPVFKRSPVRPPISPDLAPIPCPDPKRSRFNFEYQTLARKEEKGRKEIISALYARFSRERAELFRVTETRPTCESEKEEKKKNQEWIVRFGKLVQFSGEN